MARTLPLGVDGVGSEEDLVGLAVDHAGWRGVPPMLSGRVTRWSVESIW